MFHFSILKIMHYNIDNNNTKIVESWKEKITDGKNNKT